ncbi:MAG: hypothetical protein AAF235_04805 [Planctomycetota bacterium]
MAKLCESVARSRGVLASGGLLALLVPVVGGCATAYNERHSIGNVVTVPAIDGGEGDAAAVAGLADLTLTPRLDRGGWDPVTFAVPVDGTVHTPTWSTLYIAANDGSARREGLFPTAETALELRTASETDVSELLAGAPLALADVLFIPIRMVTDPACERQQSPTRMWKRTPQREDGGTWYAGPAASEAGG